MSASEVRVVIALGGDGDSKGVFGRGLLGNVLFLQPRAGYMSVLSL